MSHSRYSLPYSAIRGENFRPIVMKRYSCLQSITRSVTRLRVTRPRWRHCENTACPHAEWLTFICRNPCMIMHHAFDARDDCQNSVQGNPRHSFSGIQRLCSHTWYLTVVIAKSKKFTTPTNPGKRRANNQLGSPQDPARRDETIGLRSSRLRQPRVQLTP